MMARSIHLYRYLDPLSPHSKKNIKFEPPLTKLSGFAHVNYLALIEQGHFMKSKPSVMKDDVFAS